ncbi:hypothetical protein U1Q18_017321, partial [Sarracenia purpurea var. burkii]
INIPGSEAEARIKTDVVRIIGDVRLVEMVTGEKRREDRRRKRAISGAGNLDAAGDNDRDGEARLRASLWGDGDETFYDADYLDEDDNPFILPSGSDVEASLRTYFVRT